MTTMNPELLNFLLGALVMLTLVLLAVVVGGTALTGGRFLLLGSFIGALLLQTLTQTMYYAGVPPAVAPVPKAILILAVCLLQSDRTRGWLKALFNRRSAVAVARTA